MTEGEKSPIVLSDLPSTYEQAGFYALQYKFLIK